MVEAHFQEVKDSKGNSLSFVRQVPSCGFELVITSKDGTVASFELVGANLKAVAEKLASAAEFAGKYGRER